MDTTLIPPDDVRLNDSALRTITKLSQRSPTELALLKSLWITMADTLEYETSFFLHVPTSRYDRTSKTRTAAFQDAGTLLSMPRDLALLVIHRVEGRIHKLVKNDLSEEQWLKVQKMGNRLAIQHPDHITNIIRLWRKVMDIQGEEVQEATVKGLGLLWQHRSHDAVIILDNLEKMASQVSGEDEKVPLGKSEEEKVKNEVSDLLEE